VFSTDPRHSFQQTDGASHRALGVSQWPENLGLGALGDAELVERYGRIVRDDYRAMGIRMALHPQVDLTTEPRWGRQAQSFGSDSRHSAELVAAFLRGLQGETLGADGVAATTKHFPGGGPQLDGEDPHFPYGREQVYPAGRFEDHLAPFRAAIAAGTAAIMPYYGMPVGLELDGEPVEEVGFAFNHRIITGLLREELGFDGVVLSDFGLVTDMVLGGKPFPAKAWGLEQATEAERVERLVLAGVDQFGGEMNVAGLRELVDSGRIPMERITESAERSVDLMLRLGLFGPDLPAPPLNAPDAIELGHRSQAEALTVLTNDGVLPLSRPARVLVRGLAADALPAGWSVDDVDPEFAIVRLAAPFEHRDTYFLENGMQQGSLEFDDATVREVLDLADRVPTVLVVTLSRPAILTPFVGRVAALVGDFGASDQAVLDALTGTITPRGRLPFELPRDMSEVADHAPDLAGGMPTPLFRAGWVSTPGIPGADGR
jgi:beta-glucosidase